MPERQKLEKVEIGGVLYRPAIIQSDSWKAAPYQLPYIVRGLKIDVPVVVVVYRVAVDSEVKTISVVETMPGAVLSLKRERKIVFGVTTIFRKSQCIVYFIYIYVYLHIHDPLPLYSIITVLPVIVV